MGMISRTKVTRTAQTSHGYAMELIMGSIDSHEVLRVVKTMAKIESTDPEYSDNYALGVLASVVADLNRMRGIK